MGWVGFTCDWCREFLYRGQDGSITLDTDREHDEWSTSIVRSTIQALAKIMMFRTKYCTI